MGGRIPGTTCTTKLDPDWCKKGTLGQSPPSASGPLGMLMSMVMAAAPPLSEEEQADRNLLEWRRQKELEKQQEQASLERDTPIHVRMCIDNLARLPVGKTGAWRTAQERDLILKKLAALNAAGKIRWVDDKDHEEERGGHSRGEITVKMDFHWGDWDGDAWMKSAPVLVHEGTHAVWGSKAFNDWRDKWRLGHAKNSKEHPKGEALIAEETYAWENELKVYAVLRERGLNDMELETRLSRRDAGGIETMVRAAYPAWIHMDGFK